MSDADRPARAANGTGSRITEARHQARRALLTAASFAVAAPIAAVVPHDTGTWLPLHLFLVGALLSAIAGTTQYLAVTWSNAPAPSRRMAATQRWMLGLGTVAVAFGRERPSRPSVDLGGVAIVGALVLVVVALVGVRRRGTVLRFRPAVDAYLLAIVSSVAGITLGVALATGVVGDHASDVRAVHIAVNAFGLVGLVLAGTLPFFVATQIRSKMSARATPGRIRAVIAVLAGSVVLVVVAIPVDRPGLAATGYAIYAAGLLAEVALFPKVKRRNLQWGGPRLVQLATGYGWWVGTTVALAVHEGTGRLDPDRLLLALVVGGFAQLMVASLAYLGPVLRGGGKDRLGAGFDITRSWISLAAGNAAAIALVVGADQVVVAVIIVWALDLLVRGARLLTAPLGSAPADDVRPRAGA
jgi:nitrite reductase (NO-forming)